MKLSKKNVDKILELYYSGKLDDESREIVQGWLSSDDNHKGKDANIDMLFEKIVKKQRKPDKYTLESLAIIQEELGFTNRTTRPAVIPLRRRKSFGPLVGAAIAAAVFIAGIFILPEIMTTTSEPGTFAGVTITAEPDVPQEITLPDGSIIKMKGATTIAHADNFAVNRRVKIDGEAYFIVARDEQHPFTVESNDVEVTVLGTEFYMNAFESSAYAEVVLATGKIKVSSGEASVTLLPSEKATIDKTRHIIHQDEISEGELLRFRGINLSLEDVSLNEAFRLIGGYYQVTMKVSEHISNIDGIVVKLDDDATLDETLFFLQAVNPIFDYKIEDNMVTITKRN